MSTFLRSTRRGVLAIGTAAIVTSVLPRLRATETEASVGGVPTGPVSFEFPEFAGGLREDVHQPVRRGEWRAVSRCDRRQGPSTPAGPWLAADLVPVAHGDAGARTRLRSHRGRSARHWPIRQTRERYDAGAQANDMVALMEALGHRRFAMVGFDTGMPIGYALAADHPDRLERLVVGEASSRA